MIQELADLASVSRRLGADLGFVFLGGGNTSFKTANALYIKPSGIRLATIEAGDFICLNRSDIRRVFAAQLPDDVWEREAAVKTMMLAAVRPANSGRPSVEAPLHDAICYPYVVHLHPALVNGMTCSRDGAAVCRRLFPEALWIEYVNPGYALAALVSQRLAAAAADGRQPRIIFLQNHGVFVGGTSLAEIEAEYAQIMATLTTAYKAAGIGLGLTAGDLDGDVVSATAPVLRGLLGTPDRLAIVTSAAPFDVAAGPLSPDHIVTARSFPLIDPAPETAVARFRKERGHLPKVISMPDKAVFCAGTTLKEARETLVAARDGALVQSLSRAFGGPHFIPADGHVFIENWEVEAYRRQVEAGTAAAGRLPNRVCLVTGAAQGFGQGIAERLAAEGAVVIVADLNIAGAEKAAAEINARFGPHSALAAAVNIAAEDSVAQMIRTVVQACGGIDLFVANAGVLKAGPVTTFERADWDLVTAVNYTGYFLCVKHVTPIMARQHRARPEHWGDIVQINSKSGLEGSSRNAAYAGSKFGTIGLTQSFAKELVEDGIKVNSICPGNFFDGPLWNDPENGLFVQYLRAGKVPGAQSIADVRRAYEEKVPMRRGCTPEDVVRAILYLVEQQYETGQALPVTGGQIMLG